MPKIQSLSPELIKAYQEEIAKNSSQATAKRKSMSLNKFFDWAEDKGHITANPLAESSNSKIQTPNKLKPQNTKPKVTKRAWATVGITIGLVILIFLLLQKIRLPIPFTITPAQQLNNQVTTNIQPSSNSANSAVIGAWNLFAKLKLTSVSGTPQVGTQTLSFKLYNQETGGSPLYTSDPQSVTTDSNGSTLISLDKVPTDLFFQNNQLFLEPEINNQPSGTRIPVETANTAANLQGYYPANPEKGAGSLTVPVIDATGSLNLASQSPAVKATQGNLLIEGQTVTLHSQSGGDGNIEISPDGNGITHFLFQGNGQNFLNAQAPNLTNGSLFYGIVANNSLGTGYNLLNLQSGSSPTTKFSVDGSGDTFTAGNSNIAGNVNATNVQTGGITRLNSLGRLGSITGYYQDSGTFVVNQGTPDYASITKTATTSTGGALADVLTLTLDESALASGSNYSTLVLNRNGGGSGALALNVATGNSSFAGQIRLGNFSANPGAIGTGSIIYNSTDGKVYYWNGSSWQSLVNGASAFSGSFADLTSGTNMQAAMVVGSGASLNYTGTGTINASSLEGSTWEVPGTIGSTTPNTGAFSTLSASGAIAANGGSLTTSATTFNLVNATATTVNIGGGATASVNIGPSGATGIISLSGGASDTGCTLTGSSGNFTCSGNITTLATSGTQGWWQIIGSDLSPKSTSYNLAVGGTNSSAPFYVTAAGDVSSNSISTGGTSRISSSGNLTNIGTTQFNTQTYTWPASQTTSYVLQTNGTGTLSWVDPSAVVAPSIYWTESNGAVYPKNNSVDLLVGSNATSSAKFAVTGVNGGLPTASIAGDVANVATYLTGDGNLATTNARDLNLGGSTTGNVVINSRGSTALTANGNNLTTGNNLTVAGTTYFANGTTYFVDTSGNATLNAGTFAGNVAVNGGSLTTTQTTGNLFTTNATTINLGINGNGSVNVGGGSGANGCTFNDATGSLSCAGNITSISTTGTQGFWSLGSGALYPNSNSTDVLIGSNSTSSAKFAFTGVDGGTPTATIAGTIANVATFIDGNGNLSTTNRNNLTLGNSATYNTTGNILLNPNGTGTVGIGTTSPTALLDVNGNASVSGTLAFHAGTGTIQSTTFSPLVLGGTTTGNITISPSNDVAGGFLAPNTAGNTDLGTSANYFRNIFGGTINAATAINTGAGAGTTRIDASGNLTNIGTTQLHGVTYTWPGADGSSGYALTTNGSGTLSWAPASGLGTNYWNLTNGAVYPQNNTIDLLVGGNSTASAKFAFANVLTGVPTASIAGNVANVATFIDGNGNVSTTNRNNLTLGNSSTYNTTGNILLSPNGTGYVGIGVTSPTNKLVVGADLGATSYPNNTIALGNASGNSILTMGQDNSNRLKLLWTYNATPANAYAVLGDAAGTHNLILQDAGGNVGITTTSPTAKLDVNGSASVSGTLTFRAGTGTIQTTAFNPLTIGGATTGNITLNPSNAIAGGFVAPNTTNVSDLGTASLLWRNIYATTLHQNGNLVCDASGANCPAGSTQYWGQTLGALYPLNNTTDLLIGAAATTSAKFAFQNVGAGLPTASIAGDIANVATYLTGDGNLSTTNMQALTLGSSSTGNVIINSRGSTAITANGANTTLGGTLTFPFSNTLTGVSGLVQASNGYSVGGGTTYYLDGTGALSANTGTFASTVTLPNTNTLTGLANFVQFNNGLEVGGGATYYFDKTGNINANTISTGATQRIDASGNLTNIGTTQFHGITYTWPASDAAVSGYVLSSNAAGALSWVAQSGTGSNWTLSAANGILYPNSQTVDVLIGGSATTSAKFAFKGVDGGTPTASISGTTANVATFIDGNGNLSTTNRADLTLGNSSTYNTTGNILLNPNGTGNVGIGTTGPGAPLDVEGGTDNITNAITKTSQFSRTLGGTLTGNISDDSGLYNNLVINATDATFNHTTDGIYNTLSLSNGNTTDTMRGIYSIVTNNSTALSPDTANTATVSSAIQGTAINNAAGVISSQYGGSFSSYNNNTGAVTSAVGISSNAYNNNASGTITSAYGTYSQAFNNVAGNTIANVFGANNLANTNVNGTTITTAYGTRGNAYIPSTQSTSVIGTGYGGFFQGQNANTSYGVYAQALANYAGTNTFTNYYGTKSDCQNNSSTTTITNCYGVNSSVTEALGTITNGYAGYFNIGNALGTSYGLYSNVTGASTTNYGLYTNVSGGSTNYALYTNGTAQSSFGGNVAIGKATPLFALDVNGNASISGTLSLAPMVQGTAGTCNASSAGKEYYDGVANQYYFCNGSAWTAIGSGSGTNYWQLNNKILSPANSTYDLAIGGTATGSAFQVFGSENATSGLEALNSTVTTTGNVLSATASALTSGNIMKLSLGGTTTFSGNALQAEVDTYGGGSFTGNFLKFGNNTTTVVTVDASGDISGAGSLQIGSGTHAVAYSRFGTSATDGHGLSAPSDVLFSGKTEFLGNIFLDNGSNGSFTISDHNGTGTILFPADPTADFRTLSAGSWKVDNTQNIGKAAFVVNQSSTVNDLFDASASGAIQFKIANNGDTTVGNTGLGKITVGTVDPPYTINGQKYATYLPGITGVKEETTGTVATTEYVPGKGYRSVIDFNNPSVGSDIWLFSKATDIKNNIGSLVALLTPADNTRSWYEIDSANNKLAIYSSEPTSISYRLTASRFDSASHPNTRTDSVPGFVLDIPDVANVNAIATTIQTLSNYVISKVSDGVYVVKDGSGVVIDGIESIGNFVAANIKAGAIVTKQFTADSLQSGEAVISNLYAVNSHVALISPLANNNDINIQIGNVATDSGQLNILNAKNNTVASIDTQGNATFSGIVHSQNIDQIQALLNQVTTDQSVLLAATSGANLNATSSANIANLITTDLYVTHQAAVNSLSVTNNLTIGSDLVFSSSVNSNQSSINSINTLSSPLRLQSLAMAPIEIMAGLVKIDTKGNVQIAGDLDVAGRIKSGGLTLTDNQQSATQSASLLTLQNSIGSQVASVDASGSANFNNLETQGLTIAGASLASSSSLINGIITTNSTVGSAVIPANTTEITINNPKVTDYSLVYVTPTGSTQNNVLYIKSKQAGGFVVGFDHPVPTDVSFNWWIVQIQN